MHGEQECEPIIVGVESVYEGPGETSWDYIYSCEHCHEYKCKHHPNNN